METKHTLDIRIEKLEAELTKLRLTRSADIRAAHTFTAADYRIRIVLSNDEWDIEEIMGEPAGEGDSPSVFEYQARLEAIADGTSGEELWTYGYIVEERDPETGEFEQIDDGNSSVGGFHYLSNDSYAEFEKDMLESNARHALPKGINLADVEIVRE